MDGLRYVVLRHEGFGDPHYDFMIERQPAGPLATWRVPVWPPASDTVAEQIGDHRGDYLTYEGDVSNSRGTVKRVEGGTYQHAPNKFGIQTYVLAGSGRKIMMRNTGGTRWAVWTAEPPE